MGGADTRATERSPDLFMLLRGDHDRIVVLLEQLIDSPPAPPALRQALLHRLQHELDVHAALEEEYLYPELAQVPAAREAAHHAEQQHAGHAMLLRELAALPLGSAEWVQALQRLQQVLEAHFALEENELFSLARRQLPPERAVELGRRAALERQHRG